MSMLRLLDARTAALALLGAFAAGCDTGPAGSPPEGAIDLALPWVQAAPETVGLDANELHLAGELGASIERLRSLLVVREGRLALERYYGGFTVDSLADARSVTKSILATLVGIAIEEGSIDRLDQPVTDFLDDPGLQLRNEHTTVTVRHLLMMTGGFLWLEAGRTGYNDWILSGDHLNYLLSVPLESPPGESFTYNSAAVHLLGVILSKAVGKPLPQYADEVLFGPLGISERDWEQLSDGYVNGGSGIDLRPRDLARIGQLYLQEGWSQRRTVVPEPWVEQVVERRWESLGSVDPIGTLSYGFLWWIDVERGAYLAWGYAGQFIYVVPSRDLIVVATTDFRGVGNDIGPAALQAAVLDLIVNRIVPAAR